MEPTRLVMVVDDERQIEKMIGRQLQRGGYENVSFHDPRKAMEFFRENHNRLDLAVLDVKMPVMSGLEMAYEMFKIESTLPIILITGASEDIQEEIGDNIKKVLRKPVPSKELIDSVREYLDI
jgi:FixJ family two-component response regulator